MAYVDKGDQLDETPYPDSEWSIVWLSRELSDEELRILGREGYISGLAPREEIVGIIIQVSLLLFMCMIARKNIFSQK